jgi:hypothetical protein
VMQMLPLPIPTRSASAPLSISSFACLIVTTVRKEGYNLSFSCWHSHHCQLSLEAIPGSVFWSRKGVLSGIYWIHWMNPVQKIISYIHTNTLAKGNKQWQGHQRQL